MNIQHCSYPPLQQNPGKLLAIREWSPSSVATETMEPQLIALNEQQQVWKIDLLSGAVQRIAQLDLMEFHATHPVQLVISPCGRFAAVSNTLGRHAVVLNLESGNMVMELNRGEYHYDKSTYPLAFVQRDQQVLLIHGKDWNRLELTSLLPDVRAISERPVPQVHSDSYSRDDHYLDYFHGQLHVSPDGKYVAETGWAWTPVGITVAWSMDDWMNNVWESEDGESRDRIWSPLIDWDVPMVWLDHERLAIWGQVDEDMLDEEDWDTEGTAPAILIYHVNQRTRQKVLLEVPAFSMDSGIEDVFMHPQAQLAVSSAGTLFAWGQGLPLYSWNLTDWQVEIHDYPALPDLYHVQADSFLKIEDGRIEAWRFL
ncbi:hypothetical protein [Paenibacillus kandeliae]|uniref:hypothetical protein n=1 Tax=Paenibacillus kandeliae TaxID=3231269 RepID=UPI0034598D56